MLLLVNHHHHHPNDPAPISQQHEEHAATALESQARSSCGGSPLAVAQRQRRVHFAAATSVTVIQLEKETIATTRWYTASDYQAFRMALKQDKKWAATRNPSEPGLSSLWHFSSNEEQDHVLYRVYQACCQKSKHGHTATSTTTTLHRFLTEELHEHYESDHDDTTTTWIGLERHSTRQKSIARDIATRRLLLWDVLLVAQQSQQEQEQDENWTLLEGSSTDSSSTDSSSSSTDSHSSSCSTATTTDSYALQADFVRLACQEISRPSALWAHEIAQALAVTLK